MDNVNYCWYAVYTRPRSEKKADKWLNEDGIETYLPLKKTLKQWSDRKKMVEEPLIPSYLFVKISNKERVQVMNSPYVISFIRFNGQPAEIREKEIDLLRLMLNELPNDITLLSNDIKKGDKVEIIAGPLAGSKGEVIKQKGKHHFQLHIEPLGFAVQVQVQAALLQKI